MSIEHIYEKKVLVMRKSKWRKYDLQIKILPMCQETLFAHLESTNEKHNSHSFGIYGYERNNDNVSLIASQKIHVVKLESLDTVTELSDLLVKYIKDVSFKIQFKSCSISQPYFTPEKWYTLHVQTNRICFTIESGSHLVVSWKRHNIVQCNNDDGILNIDIIINKEKSLYSFVRDEKYLLEKINKAILNLKFECVSTRPEKFTLAPRRSGSVDLKKIPSRGNVKDRIERCRTYSSSKADDSLSNDDSSPPSTPCSPSFIGEQKNYNHIDEKDEELEELDELMFPLDQTDSDFNGDLKVNGYQESNLTRQLSNENKKSVPAFCQPYFVATEYRLVVLERFPFEFDIKSQGKMSPDLNSQNLHGQLTTYIHNPNMFEKSKNGSCYQSMDSIKHHRKTCSEANFAQHQKEIDKKNNISHSADINCTMLGNFSHILCADKISQCSSSLLPLSSSNISSDTRASSKSTKDPEDGTYLDCNQQLPSPTTTSYSDHDYYNIKYSLHVGDHVVQNYPYHQPLDDSQYFNLSQPLPPGENNLNVAPPMSPEHHELSDVNNSSLNYVELDFSDHIQLNISRKSPSSCNYKDINIEQTEVLKDLDNNIKHIVGKKKRPSFIKSLFKK